MANTIFLVQIDQFSAPYTRYAFSTREKAQEFINTYEWWTDEPDVEIVSIDEEVRQKAKDICFYNIILTFTGKRHYVEKIGYTLITQDEYNAEKHMDYFKWDNNIDQLYSHIWAKDKDTAIEIARNKLDQYKSAARLGTTFEEREVSNV